MGLTGGRKKIGLNVPPPTSVIIYKKHLDDCKQKERYPGQDSPISCSGVYMVNQEFQWNICMKKISLCLSFNTINYNSTSLRKMFIE